MEDKVSVASAQLHPDAARWLEGEDVRLSWTVGGGVLLLHRNGRSRPRNCRDVSLFRQLESFRGQVDATALAEMLHCSFSPS